MLNLIGQTLDGKYAIERELGRGGMGTVYFATHIGTERPVAVKVIAPQFMAKTEFVERFRREARAAGRLRHPNVVDVTDFGIADTAQGNVAYLVMEYLDGCTLGEILEEEKQIPLSWTLDILEQVCSAVSEAHEQGIIHRDLKPDNIWLEPNQRGGYTVKVLDFGIAKLEEHIADHGGQPGLRSQTSDTGAFNHKTTIADHQREGTASRPANATIAADPSAMTLMQPAAGGDSIVRSAPTEEEAGTAILPRSATLAGAPGEDGTQILTEQSSNDGTQILTERHDADKHETVQSSELTRVGAVLGTPLYMSPEQCRGEKLDPRSDIYSLGIISYQMLSGETPFNGDYTSVMKAHRESPVPPLAAKRVSSRVKNVVMSALSKEAENRPETAEAYASILRSHSEGLGTLIKHGISIYGEHLTKFFAISLVIGMPFVLLTILRVTIQFLGIGGVIDRDLSIWVNAILSLVNFFVQIFFGAIVIGVTTWIVAQILATPLRPISMKAGFRQVKKRWKSLIFAITINSLLVMAGFAFLLIPGLILTTVHMLIGPAIMMEGISGLKAFKRSRILVLRSFWTVFGSVIVMHIIPIFLALVMSLSIMAIIRSGVDIYEQKQKVAGVTVAEPAPEVAEKDRRVGVSIGPTGVEVSNGPKAEGGVSKESSLQRTAAIVSQGIFELLWTPIVIFINSFVSVITALIYFKTRQAGGESMQDLLAQFEDAETNQRKWQQRVRARLQHSGRSTSKSGSKA